MYKGGYTGKILRVNLSDREARVEVLDNDFARNILGGAGLGIGYLFNEVGPAAGALEPENKIIFSIGPLTATGAPCASRMSVTAKSPLTGAVGMSLSGGYFPTEMKRCGYDGIIIEGKADNPVYLWIRGDKVEFRDASKLWGTNTFDCQAFIKSEIKDQDAKIACIGPAGENLVRFACVINERRAAGRKGLGAVMGSKNLKAIAIRGNTDPVIADPEAFKEARRQMLAQMKDSPILYEHFSHTGTSAVLDVTGGLGILAAKNWAETGVFVPAENLGADANAKLTTRREHCQDCPVGCSQVRLAQSGRYVGFLAEGPEFETLYGLGTMVGNDNLESIIAGDRLCDEYGLDTISVGSAIAFAMELFERGILSLEEADGRELRFGNADAMVEMLTAITYRQGLGDILAEGVKIAAEKIGRGSEKYAMHIKGLEMPAYDIRGAKAHGLGYATSFTGADHSRGYAFQEIFGIPVPYAVDRFAIEGKGKLCKWNQDVRTVTCDCAPMCAFLLDMAVAGDACGNTARLVNAVTGWDLTAEEVQQIGERVSNLAKVYNIREGFTRADDTFPERIMSEPLKDGGSKGQLISREDLDIMLDEYYEERGWNKSGVPTREKLIELGLDYVLEDKDFLSRI